MAVNKSTGFVLNYSAEWTYQDGEGGNPARLVANYEDDRDGFLDRLPTRGSEPPSEVFSEFAGFALVTRAVSGERGGKVRVQLTYEAVQSVDEEETGDDTIPRYSLQISLGEEPILTHPRYAELVELEKVALAHIAAGERFKTEEAKELWKDDVTTELGLELLAKIEDGLESYLDPQLVWRETRRVTWAEWEEIAEMEDSGNIQVPAGNPPNPGNRNYLYLGPQLQQDESGEFAELVRDWQLSGRNGWDVEIYNPVDN